ncbi:MAG: hypothetical protein KA186_13475 [Flavobacteriales bacterium]|nr:hypothetical protein [Flavobacteriales bacterium]
MMVRTKPFKWKNDLVDYVLALSILFFLISMTAIIYGENPDRSLILGSGIMAALSGLTLFMKNTHYGTYRSPFVVEFDGNEIRSSHPKRSYGSIQVDGIVEVGILTTDEGPIAPDVWIVLLDSKGLACTFPSDAEGHKPVIDLLLKFEGFDHRTFIEAMGSTSNAKFIVWQKQSTV